MDTAKIFSSGRSQAVRLPKAFRLEGKEVYVKRMGAAVVLLPKKGSWDNFFNACEEFSDDFMSTRDQGQLQERAPIEMS